MILAVPRAGRALRERSSAGTISAMETPST